MTLQRLRDLREDADLKQEDIAKILHISKNTYSMYERGLRTIQTEMLIKLAKFYEVSIDYIAGLTNNKRGLNNLEKEQEYILNIYTQLNDRNKGKVETYIEILIEKQSRAKIVMTESPQNNTPET